MYDCSFNLFWHIDYSFYVDAENMKKLRKLNRLYAAHDKCNICRYRNNRNAFVVLRKQYMHEDGYCSLMEWWLFSCVYTHTYMYIYIFNFILTTPSSWTPQVVGFITLSVTHLVSNVTIRGSKEPFTYNNVLDTLCWNHECRDPFYRYDLP